jgi:hypothetical protein
MVKEYKKENIIQWFCGFYEGEGWICSDKGNCNRLRLGIAQNDKTPLEIGQNIWGGSIKKRIRKSPASGKICTGYEWVLSHCQSLEFIKDIKPYMLIPQKIQQMEREIKNFEEGERKRYACKHCDSDFANPSARRRHEKNFHSQPNASEEKSLQESQIAGTS